MNNLTIRKNLPIRQALLDSFILESPHASRKEKKPKMKFGAVPGSGSKHPDEVFLEIRLLHEKYSMSDRNIALEMAKRGYNFSNGEIYRIREYQTRSHLIPDETINSYYD
jgi:hypothetical protein